MESIFSFIEFEYSEEEEEISRNEGGLSIVTSVDAQPTYFKNVLRLVRQASSIAVNSFSKPSENYGRTSKKSVLGIATFAAKFVSYQVYTTTRNILSLARNGVARPLWNYSTEIGVKLIRDAIDGTVKHDLDLARASEQGLGAWSHLMLTNVDIMELEIKFNVSELLEYERIGKEYVKLTPAWRYPIPLEDQTYLAEPNQVVMSSEWIVPFKHQGDLTQKRKLFGRRNQKRRVIYYIHGGAYVIAC
jgi:hypothetical protein